MKLAHIVAQLLADAGISVGEGASAVTCQIGDYRHTVHTYIRNADQPYVELYGFPIGKKSEDTTPQLLDILESNGLVERTDDGNPRWTKEALRMSLMRD